MFLSTNTYMAFQSLTKGNVTDLFTFNTIDLMSFSI